MDNIAFLEKELEKINKRLGVFNERIEKKEYLDASEWEEYNYLQGIHDGLDIALSVVNVGVSIKVLS